jgi:chromosome segregation ATPase
MLRGFLWAVRNRKALAWIGALIGVIGPALALWFKHRPALSAQEKALEAARQAALQRKRERTTVQRSGTWAQVDAADAKVKAATEAVRRAEKALADLDAKAKAAEAEMGKLRSPAEMREAERDLLK